MTIESKKKLEKEEEGTDSEDEYSVVMDKNELHRIDGIVAERLAVFEVSELLLRG